MRHRQRLRHARLMGGAAFIALAIAAGGAQAQTKSISIAPQPLDTALNELGFQAGQQVLIRSDITSGKTTRGVSNAPSFEIALVEMLRGTGLSYRREGDTYLIVEGAEGGSPQGESAAGGGAEVEELIVTAQKKEEQIQDVPIAISAFTQKSLDAQKIEGGFDLLKAIPNVTFSKNNFSGYNFSIRGIGTKAVSATTDPGVAVAFNNSTLIVNRLFEQEYFDIERVEVLRGPQGTLYGRNATSGVINVISSKPRLGEFEGDVKLEIGNYNAQRARGMINIPIGETLAIRATGAMTKRDGYGYNEASEDPDNDVRADVDGRDLWSARVTVGWEPIEQIRVNALWERFEEDDNRVRTSKQLCHRDPGMDFDSFSWADIPKGENYAKPFTSQGCKAGSLYDEGAFGTPNGASLPYVLALLVAPELGATTGSTLLPGPVVGIGGNPYYDNEMYGDYNANPLPAPCPDAAIDFWMSPINICQPDPYGGRTQSRDLRSIHSLIEPTYRAKADIFELSIDLELTDSLSLTSQTVYSRDEVYASQDYNRYTTVPIFNDPDQACDIVEKFDGASRNTIDEFDCGNLGGYGDGYYSNILSGGVFIDPQLGASNTIVAQDLSKAESEQFNQEFRLASNFDAPVNFSLGANFTRFETMNDYYVFINALTLISYQFPFNTHDYTWCDLNTRPGNGYEMGNPCIYVDPNPLESIDGQGHNYFRSANPYELTSSAIFGEFYWQAADTVKVTLGGRMSWDRKVFTPLPSQLLLYDYRRFSERPGDGPEDCTDAAVCKVSGTGFDGGQGAAGSVALPDIVQEWREPTGRLIVDWKPDLAFTDETMVYGSIAHGYKGGGANPPSIAPPAGLYNVGFSEAAAPPTFEPEYIDAFEIGTKNTLLGGALILNGSAFYYDYEGYQVSKIVDRSAFNENFDATIWGLELEWIYAPTRNLRFNGTVGHLRTKIADGAQSIDLMDRTQGGNQSFTGPNGATYDRWMVLKPWITNSSNCIAPVDLYEAELIKVATGVTDAPNTLGLCATGGILADRGGVQTPDGGFFDPFLDAPNGGAGFFADLGGNELPNAPRWTVSFGAQYRMALPGGWDATLRGDFYWQEESFARVYNTEYDRLKAWTNTNVSLWVENPDWGVTAEVYVKNAFDETPITDAFLNSDDSGLTTNVFTLDPRLVGVSVRKSF